MNRDKRTENGELSIKNKDFWGELVCIVVQIANELVNSL